MACNDGTGRGEPDRNHEYLPVCISVFSPFPITDLLMVHAFSGHQAYIVSKLENAGTKVAKTEKLNTCRKEQEEIKGMKIWNLLI